ncbi:MAG TPA: class I adenylate-forming enzyme family protein [Acetobacteraceae bacterium]|nr:class I adenylate-forming enzyme family protein [Acetobacteraceae bacterium]
MPGLLADIFAPSGRLAFVKDGERWSGARLVAEADRLAAGLAAAGVGVGDRVALHLRNGPEIALAYLACFRLGAIAAPLCLRFETAELDALLRRLRPRLYIGDAEPYRRVAPIGTGVLGAGARYVLGEPEDKMARSWASLHLDPAPEILGRVDPDAPAVLLPTSGIGGELKLVVHSQATLACMAARMANFPILKGDLCAFFLPMTHAVGLFSFIASQWAGAALIMLDADDPAAILNAIETHRCTYFITLPMPLARIMERQHIDRRDVSSLRFCATVGDVCLPGQQRAFPSLFGLPLRSFWGATEAVGSCTYGLQAGAVSRPIPGAEIRLVDEEDQQVARGEPGEMKLRGSHIALGYWSGPGEWGGFTDGWYRTGDIMREDEDGNLWFVARARDLILRAGASISPVEVEQALAEHPDVRDAGVAGLPDPVFGRRIVGFVQLKKGAGVERLEDILRAASTRLADYKMPERLLPVATIPRNSLGKIDRAELARMA